MPDSAIEIITGRERRRRWSMAEKSRIVSESLEPLARVADVAARHDVCPSLLHGWRRLAREGRLGTGDAAVFVPVRLAAEVNGTPPPAIGHGQACAPVEVILPSGGRILIRHDAGLPALRAVITALRG